MAAVTKVLAASLLLSLLLLHQLVQADQLQSTMTDPQTSSIDCGAACTARCQQSSRPHLCKRACGTCCSRCQCVPPGTSGNYDACPCYAALTTHGNKRKCP
ncbi:hypothetical protein NE237_024221 [Protea cynaroides]|uniref:Snakin-2 n=1 Tax=Protea cynaroides TaxID=273540 RepID=A0A9Q0HDC3_9MAGN|nr:hypothetical protein NE237_024221 [Protea cynaroides]